MKAFNPTSEAEVYQLISDYRVAFRNLEAATDEPARDKWQRITSAMRANWEQWNDADCCLHETAFGPTF